MVMWRAVDEVVGEGMEAEAWEGVDVAAELGVVVNMARRLFQPPTTGSIPRLTLISQR
jgi:hypothetical protein